MGENHDQTGKKLFCFRNPEYNLLLSGDENRSFRAFILWAENFYFRREGRKSTCGKAGFYSRKS